MNAELIFVGSELVSGKTLNTNASYASKKLKELGLSCFMQHIVDDNKERIIEVFTASLAKSDLIIVSGGLGPTADDITKEAVCEALGLELFENEKCKKHIESFFARLGKKPTPNNYKQALTPRDSIIFPNDIGTACGLGIEYGKRRIILLPGPPKEFTYMFDTYISPYLKKSTVSATECQTINVFGMGESAIETIIKPFCNLDNPTVATYCKENECEILVTASANTKDAAHTLCSNTVAQIKSLLGDIVYGINSAGLAYETVNLLRKSGLKVATAESCTGGMLSESLTSVPHASDAVEIGITAYSNRIKNEALSVPQDVLLEEGAISAETAMYLAKNVRILSDADIGVGITGNAGPTASENKPVGLVYVSIADKTKYFVKKLELPEGYGRDKIRSYATLTALDLVRRYVLSRPNALEGMISFGEDFTFSDTDSISSNTVIEENFAVFEVDENFDFDNDINLTNDNSNEYMTVVDTSYNEDVEEASKSASFKAFLRRHWIKLASVAVLLVLLVCSTVLISNLVHENRQKSLVLDARDSFKFEQDEKSDETGIYTAFNPLIEQNSDIKAWLIVGATNIDNPVYQSDDNKYYQNHNMLKEKSPYGALFFDKNNTINKDSIDQNLTIYGHNTENSTMFGELKSYRSLSFYKSNSVIKFKNLYSESEYVIFAVFISNADPDDDNGNIFNYTKANFATDEEFEAFVNEAKLRSLISVPVDIAATDSLLTLSTASHEFENARLVVMAKQITSDNDVKLSKNATLNTNAKYPQAWYDKNNLTGYQEESAPTSSEPTSSGNDSSEPTGSDEPSSSEPSSDEPSSSEPSSAPSSSQTTSSAPTTACTHQAPNELTNTDGNNHSFKCTKCGQTVTVAHSFTEENTDSAFVCEKATCTSAAKYYKSCKCGAKSSETFTSGEPNKHEASAEYAFDDDKHWKVCISGCQEHFEENAHDYTSGNCACGKEKPEAITE